MQVRDLMSSSVVSIAPGESAALAARLLSRHNIGSLPVCGGDVGHAQGILDMADIEPSGDLPGGEPRHSQFVAECGEFLGIFSVQVFRIGHFAGSGFVPGDKNRQKIKIFGAGRTILNFYPYICGA